MMGHLCQTISENIFHSIRHVADLSLTFFYDERYEDSKILFLTMT
jgi:hypothetical protein